VSRPPEEREIITVPYLNPLVLRKELENMFENDGITTLQFPEVVQEKSIIFWNLVSEGSSGKRMFQERCVSLHFLFWSCAQLCRFVVTSIHFDKNLCVLVNAKFLPFCLPTQFSARLPRCSVVRLSECRIQLNGL